MPSQTLDAFTSFLDQHDVIVVPRVIASSSLSTIEPFGGFIPTCPIK